MSRYILRATALTLAFVVVLPLFTGAAEPEAEPKKYIKWVDFTVPASLMKKTIDLDKQSFQDGTEPRLKWIELLAYLGVKCGGDFKKYKPQMLQKLLDKLSSGETMTTLTEGMKLYGYYNEAYTAVLGGLVGSYAVEVEKDGETCWEERYGLRAFHPIARGYDYQHYDDFGSGRNYGYKRKHLGHDIMALTGTPVVAAESGVVEELGWNQYGGWRVGIRSFDGKRYYYYAHLRQNRPYAEGLAKGNKVSAGDVIGYVGRTGYSSKENTNNITQSHLHFGIQLIFDESQKDGVNQIWIDPYEITKLLANHRSDVKRNPETKEYTRTVPYRETNLSMESARKASSLTQTDPGIRSNGTMALPVVMYHAVLKAPGKQGTYTISPNEFEQDLIWLRENGYTSISIGELIDFVEKGSPLPDKPVMLTFDDGYYNNIHYADPLLKKYGQKAVMFIVGDFIEKSEREGCQNPNFSYASGESLRRISDEGTWDIESHSYSLHRNNGKREGVRRTRGESDEAYRQMLTDDFMKIGQLVEDVTGRPPRAFAYPFGAMSREADEVLMELGVKVTFSCVMGVNEIKAGDSTSLFRLKRLLRPCGKSLSKLLVR